MPITHSNMADPPSPPDCSHSWQYRDFLPILGCRTSWAAPSLLGYLSRVTR